MHKLNLTCPLTQHVHIHKACAGDNLRFISHNAALQAFAAPINPVKARIAPAAQHLLLVAFALAPGSVRVF